MTYDGWDEAAARFGKTVVKLQKEALSSLGYSDRCGEMGTTLNISLLFSKNGRGAMLAVVSIE